MINVVEELLVVSHKLMHNCRQMRGVFGFVLAPAKEVVRFAVDRQNGTVDRNNRLSIVGSLRFLLLVPNLHEQTETSKLV